MNSPEIIFKYFPHLTALQKERFHELGAIYNEWNAKVNVVSRKDMDHFYERHVLHSLAIAKFKSFAPGQSIMDLGTGGGFPAIPLAIVFPEAFFIAVDSIRKKITVVNEVIKALDLKNIKAANLRAEDFGQTVDFVVSRATAPFADLIKWTSGKINCKAGNGLIALKGGDLTDEMNGINNLEIKEISEYFNEEFFLTKKLIFKPLE